MDGRDDLFFPPSPPRAHDMCMVHENGVYAILEQQPMAIAKLLTARRTDVCAYPPQAGRYNGQSSYTSQHMSRTAVGEGG